MLFQTLITALVAVSAYASPLSKRADTVGVSQTVFDDLHTHAKLAASAYCNLNNGFTCISCDPANTVEMLFDSGNSDVTAFVTINNAAQEIVASWKGTNSFTNLVQDLTFTTVAYTPLVGSCNGCRVHDGFDSDYKLIGQQILSKVQALSQQNPDFKVSVVGHSLGGALASLSALDMKNAGLPVTAYTFGEPRVGNQAYADTFNAAFPAGSSFRVTHNDDPVPLVPPQGALFGGYVHEANEFFINTEGIADASNIVICQGDEDGSCNDSKGPVSVDILAHGLYMNVPIIPLGC